MLNKIGTVIFIVLCVINVVAVFVCCHYEIQELYELRGRGTRFRNYFFKIIYWLITLAMVTLGSFVLSGIIGGLMEKAIERMAN